MSPRSFFFFLNQSMTSLVLKIEQGIFSIRNVVRTKGKIPMLAKLLSGANEGRSLTSLHAGNHGNRSLNTSSPFRRCCLCPTLVPDMLGVGYHLLSGEDTIEFRGPHRAVSCSRGLLICHTARHGCLNNVCCLKGCSVFPLDYKTAGSGSCCDNRSVKRNTSQ